MLPNDDFKTGDLSGPIPDFPLPVDYVGLEIYNPPLQGWAIPVTYGFLTADEVEEEVKARRKVEISYSVELTQTQVYDFGFVFNIEFGDYWFYRRIHLFGFIRDIASAARCNFERFVAIQGEAFELVIRIYDDNGNEQSLDTVTSFAWQLRDSDGEVVRKTLDDENVYISGTRLYILVEPEELNDRGGIFWHEAQVVYGSYLYTLFHGDAEIRRVLDES